MLDVLLKNLQHLFIAFSTRFKDQRSLIVIRFIFDKMNDQKFFRQIIFNKLRPFNNAYSVTVEILFKAKINVKVGLLTFFLMPSPRANPFVNVVFPAPRSPSSKMTSPAWSALASFSAIFWVSSAFDTENCMILVPQRLRCRDQSNLINVFFGASARKIGNRRIQALKNRSDRFEIAQTLCNLVADVS